jgi:iron complex outermembrane receptor protein
MGMKSSDLLPILFLVTTSVVAQQTTSTVPSVSTTVVVLGAPIPISQEESARQVVHLDAQKYALASPDVQEYLRTDASVDVQQRGGAGVMADISIRGASFEQTLVLLNGFRMDNAETAHFNLDLPIPLHVISGIDILHGAGSTLYGSDAIGGVADFTTWKPTSSTARFSAGVGSFGENEQSVVLSGVGKGWSQVLAADRGFSTGFIADRDYRTENASGESFLRTPLGSTDLLLAGDDRKFGADQFYGPYTSWEQTKGWFAAVTQQFTPNTQAGVAYRRHSDIFLLERDEPLGYKNQHVDYGYEGELRDQRSLTKSVTLATGLEEVTDQINSTNLGEHGRNRGAGYAEAEWLKPGHASLSLGGREEVFSGGRAVFSPTVAGTRWLSSTLTMHGSVGYGFRIPTYLDLYYSDPVTLGNPNLQPESVWNYEGGLSWFPKRDLTATVTVFYSNQHNTIDYTRASAADPWKASNLPGLHFTGVEAAVEWAPTRTERVKASWTNLTGAQAALHGLQSEYVFNYPVNNGRLEWTWNLGRQVVLQNRLGVVDRFQRSIYAIADMSIVRTEGRLRPYVRMSNLTNAGYEEIVGVRMPGRSFVGGLEINLAKR